MLRFTLARLEKVSKVPIRASLAAADLSFTPSYRPKFKYQLSRKYDTVTDETRFVSLQVLLERLSGYAGRRQYKMQNDLRPLFAKIKAEGIDWHDMKHLSHDSLQELCQRTAMTAAERAVLLTVVDVRLCGVLTRGSSGRDPQTICYRRGLPEHGWRCGRGGHLRDVYFERKQPAASTVVELRRADIQKRLENGVCIEVREEPDFSVTGRLAHEAHPRVWSKPSDPAFFLSQIGYEFKIHPLDPRAQFQVVESHKQWELHAKVIESVVWEMLELYAVPRPPQALEHTPGELVPDSDGSDEYAYTRAFNHPDAGVERRMRTKRGSEQPWVRPAPLQPFHEDGTPAFLPFPPSLVIRAVYRPANVDDSENLERVEEQLHNPQLDISLMIHPSACFWLPPEDEVKCLEHILSYAKRVPFALPFNLYFRVDPSYLKKDEAFITQQAKLSSSTAAYFDLKNFLKPNDLRSFQSDEDECLMSDRSFHVTDVKFESGAAASKHYEDFADQTSPEDWT